MASSRLAWRYCTEARRVSTSLGAFCLTSVSLLLVAPSCALCCDTRSRAADSACCAACTSAAVVSAVVIRRSKSARGIACAFQRSSPRFFSISASRAFPSAWTRREFSCSTSFSAPVRPAVADSSSDEAPATRAVLEVWVIDTDGSSACSCASACATDALACATATGRSVGSISRSASFAFTNWFSTT